MTVSGLPAETRRLRLRAFETTDVDGVAAYHLLPDAQRYLATTARDRAGIVQAIDVMRRHKTLNRPGDTLFLALSLKTGSGNAIGQAALRWADATAGQAEVSMVLAPGYRGQGLGSEALAALLELGFEKFNFHRIFARCEARNEAASRLLRHAGMRLEAHYREHALFRGEWDEELHFAMLDREWARVSRPPMTLKPQIVTHRVA